MNSKLTILANQKPLALGDDFSISVELQNPLFNDNAMFSYPVEIPLEGNRHILKNLDDVNSDLRPVSFEHTPMQIMADGMPFASGTAVTSDGEEVNGSLSMNIDAGVQSFDDLIADLSCRDIAVKDKILIGEKIGNVKATITYDCEVVALGYDAYGFDYQKSGQQVAGTVSPQALGFSCPAQCEVDSEATQTAVKESVRSYPDGNSLIIPKVKQSYINVSEAYPAMPYCNARVCYKHYALDADGSTSSSTIEQKDCKFQYEDRYPYWVLDADRPQSGICFYVLYFLDCLFEQLGVQFDNSALLEIEDFKHLCFFTTKCAYTEEVLYGQKKETDEPFFQNVDAVNEWLSSRGCGGQLTVENGDKKTLSSFTCEYSYTWDKHYNVKATFVNGENGVVVTTDPSGNSKTETTPKIYDIYAKSNITAWSVTADIMGMYASSDNFPEENVSTLIESLENAFGIKFAYDYEQKKVTAYLLRNVLRSPDNSRMFHADIHAVRQESEKITGVRMVYSQESDSKEQKQNIKDGVRDYDTDYDYIDYPQSRTVTDQTYGDFFQALNSEDMRVFVDQYTGNAYRVKINPDATTSADKKPVLFEVGQFKGVEYGDCSTQNEDYVQEFSIDFQPVSFNDVNYFGEVSSVKANTSDGWINEKGYGGSLTVQTADQQPILCAYIDEDMEHEFVTQKIRNSVSSSFVDFYVTEILNLVESYDPTSSDDGNSPLQSYDWGLSLALMRGGGSDATLQTYDNDYDSFGNSKWRTVAGQYAMASDTMDAWGNEFDYNGSASGIGSNGRFSLKIRAYKQPAWALAPLCRKEVMGRGLFDTFMIDYAYFLLNRKKYRITCTASVAQIVDIQNHWYEWWLIDGKKCLINKVSTSLSVKDGMGEVTLEVYSI